MLGTQIVATLIAVYGLFMTPLGWGWCLFVWGYALAWFLVNDRVKLLAYRVFDPTACPFVEESMTSTINQICINHAIRKIAVLLNWHTPDFSTSGFPLHPAQGRGMLWRPLENAEITHSLPNQNRKNKFKKKKRCKFRKACLLPPQWLKLQCAHRRLAAGMGVGCTFY